MEKQKVDKESPNPIPDSGENHEVETTETLLMNAFALPYDKKGEGTPVLLLHGFPLNRSIWHPVIEPLSKSCLVIAPDLRGHGQSPAPKGAYSMTLLLRDVLMTLDELGIDKAIWVGHSMGGYLALHGWRTVRQRFLGLGLIASHHLPDTPEAKVRRYTTAQSVTEKGAEVVVNLPLFAKDTPEDTDYVVQTRELIRRAPPSGIVGALLAMASRPDSTATLKTITVPTVVVAGKNDQIVKPEVSDQMCALMPNAQLFGAEKAGHMPMLEEPAVVVEALLSLVAQVHPQASEA